MSEDLLALLEAADAAQRDAAREEVALAPRPDDPVRRMLAILEQNPPQYSGIRTGSYGGDFASRCFPGVRNAGDSLSIIALSAVAAEIDLVSESLKGKFPERAQHLAKLLETQITDILRLSIDRPLLEISRYAEEERADRIPSPALDTSPHQQLLPHDPVLLAAASAIAREGADALPHLPYVRNMVDLSRMLFLSGVLRDTPDPQCRDRAVDPMSPFPMAARYALLAAYGSEDFAGLVGLNHHLQHGRKNLGMSRAAHMAEFRQRDRTYAQQLKEAVQLYDAIHVARKGVLAELQKQGEVFQHPSPDYAGLAQTIVNRIREQ